MEWKAVEELSSEYPLGREKEESAQLLFKFFSNNLYFGQWELAAACIGQLSASVEYKQKVKDVLKDVIENPFNISPGGDKLASPHHLSWLCLTEYKNLCHDKTEIEELELLSRNVEFRLLLTEVHLSCPETVIQELYLYHRHVWKSGSTSASPSLGKSLSSVALTFLKDTLMTTPIFGHAIINAIKLKTQDSHRKQNEALEMLYIDCLYSLLEDISFSQLETDSESESEEIEKKLESIYTLISLFDPGPSVSGKHSSAILHKLLLNCRGEYGGKLDRYKLMSCLLSRQDNYLINEFVTVDKKCRREKLGGEYEREKIEGDERALVCVSLSKDRAVAWRALFTFVFDHRQHFLDRVINTALEFIKKRRYSELEQLLSPEELRPLRALVLLLGWSHCYTLSDARLLLSLLWHNDQNAGKTSALEQGCNKLAYQVDLIEWCLEKTRPLSKATLSGTSSQQQRATDLFQSLESHSVLYVLHHAAKLSSLQEDEVLELLEKTPNHKEMVNGSKCKRVVRFADEGEEPGNEVQNPPISLEQERDISIYRSYCALKKVMDAMKNCLDFAHLELMSPLQKRIHRKSSTTSCTSTIRGSSVSDDGNQTVKSDFTPSDLYSGANFQEFYLQNVWQQLECAKEQLAEVFPLTYRLEVLEDIFALLFMTHENIRDTLESESESGEDGAEEHRNSADILNRSINSDDDLGTRRHESQTKNKTLQQESPFDFDEPFENIYRKAALKTSLSHESNKSSSHEKRKTDRASELKMRAQQRPRSPTVDSGQQISGTSTMSTSSSTSLFKLGFMANEYVIRDILQMLRDSLFNLNTTKFRLAGKDPDSKPSDKKPTSIRIDSRSEEMLTHVVPSTVTTETLQKRTSRLTQYVSEAQWRFQLVAHPAIPRQPGQVLTETIRMEKSSSDEEFGEPQPDYEKRRPGRLPKRGQNSVVDDSGETSQQTNGGYDGTHHRRSRSSGRRKSVGTKSVTRVHTSIVSSMLSSYESLLGLCLKRGQQAQANQVVKMFNMEGHPEVAEVGFSAQYSDAVRKLHSFGTRASKDVSASSSKPGRVSMKMLANVAAAGMATASVSNITDDLLTSAKLPILTSPKNKDIIPGQFKEVFKDEQVPYLVLADLTLTSCRTWGLCNNLLQITKGQEVKVTVAAKPEIKAADSRNIRLKGSSQFLDDLQQLVQFAISCEGPETTLADQLLTKKIIGHSPELSLSLATHPLTVTGCRNLLAAIEIVQKLTEKAQHVLVENSSHKPSRDKSSPPSRLQGSPQSYSKPEQPVIHNAMKHLIHALEKHVPLGGFLLHFLRSFSENVPTNRNYLLSLYDHLKELAFLVAECEAKTKESVVVPTNYFRMLEEGPIVTLGRLMFVKKMQPAKLEKVAQKLSLNLTHIIVHSCCPVVPSKWSPPLRRETSEIHCTVDGRVVLNHCALWCGTIRHPEIVVRNLLTKIIQIMRDTANKNNARGIFTQTCAELTVQKEDYTEFTKLTQELKFVNLDLLTSREEKICFFSNLQNLLTIHSSLFHTWKQSNDQEGGNVKSERIYVPSSILEKIIQANSTAYTVGQLGVISLFELKFVINRCGLHPPAIWKKLLLSRLFVLDPVDPWYKYAPHPEPRLLFVTSDGCTSSPPIQVLSPDMVQSQLLRSMKDFLNQTVTIDLQHKLVSIPELLVWYRRDFASEKVDQFDAPNEGLVNFISTHVTGQTESQLIQLLRLDQVHEFAENIDSTGRKELPFSVTVRPFNQEHQFSFDYESIRKQAQPFAKTHRRSVSLPLSMESSDESWCLGKAKEPLTYQLTPITLEYVKDDSPLCATLVSLICSDELDDIEEYLEDDYFTDSIHKTRKRAKSDINLVAIRSYRYHRLTDDYPILQRHLMNLVVPLAAAEDPDIVKSADPILKFVTSSISNKVKGCMLNLHGSTQYQTCLAAILNELFMARDWKALHEILIWIPKMNLDETPELRVLSDFMATCLAYSLVKQGPVCNGVKSVCVASSIRQIHDLEHQTRTALALVRYLPMDTASDLVQLCLSHAQLSPSMTDALQAKMDELSIYGKITVCVKDLQVKLAMTSDGPVLLTETARELTELVGQLDRFMDWRILQKAPKDEVLSVLLRASDFMTARAWVHLQHMTTEKSQEIEEEYIISLLLQKPSNTTEVFKSLESILRENQHLCYTMCDRLLTKVKDMNNILFLTNFLLNHITKEMSNLKLDELRWLNIGAKSLLCLPESIRGEYSQLVSTPKLLLEQLLMNMKADLAGQVFSHIRPDLCKVRESRLGLYVEQFDELVARYGRKALEFPVVQVPTPDGDHSLSRTSPQVGGDSDQGSLLKSSFLDSTRMSTSRRSVDYTALNVNRPLMSTSLGASPSKKMLSPPTAALIGKKFIMPPEPPPKDKWVPDTAVSVCMVCQLERFSMFNRRHHCRRCGRVVCASCSSKTTVIIGVSSRTCDNCYEQMFKPRFDQSRDDQESYQQRMKDSLSTSTSPFLTRAPPASSASSNQSEGRDLLPGEWNIGSVIRHTEHEWKLRTDPDHNTLLRDEFYYEQAPSASLCISILGLLSSQSKAGQIMLELCDDLSKILRPISPGVPNPEVDYSLVISMMKHLLFRAKMNYIESGESPGLGMCDMYLTRVDLLNLLVSGNVSDIPSVQELTKVESVRRLRDRLIEDERLPLAMEVSTKCGLDPSGLWAAWGLGCLQCGDYTGAREKFNRCIKAPVDRNQTQPTFTSKLINEIIENLEASTDSHDVRNLLSSPGSLKSLMTAPRLRSVDESHLNKPQYEECVYYLKTYGSHLSSVQFYKCNGYLPQAAQYILTHKCSSDVFMEGLLIPSLTTEDLFKLQDQMSLTDPSLDRWSPYLTATCRYLMKSKLIHVLYQFQIFMKDFIRAAMTCVTYFYQRGARTYLNLASHVQHLFNAQRHMDAYLDPSKWGDVTPPTFSQTTPKPSWSDTHNAADTQSSSVRLIQTPAEVKRYLNTVILQIEVTKYMEKGLTAKPHDGTMVAVLQNFLSGKELPATLFGNAKMRADVVNMVLMVGEDVLTSFDLSMKIIKEYRLSTVPILTHAAHEMAKFHDYNRIRELLDCLRHAGIDEAQTVDEILGACIVGLADDPAEAKEVDSLIKMLRMDSNKINAMILVGKLKSAYLLAVKGERVEDVQRISGAALRGGQTSVKNICDKWLNQRLKKQ